MERPPHPVVRQARYSKLFEMDAFLEERLPHYLEELRALCAQPSISARREGIEPCADLVEQLLEQHGLEVRRFEGYGNPILLGRAQGDSPRTLLFYNHYDVQPPEPLELWESPPFEPTLRQGSFYARGAKDDKGELVARLAALDAVRAAHGGQPPCSVVFVVEGEEEIGSPHIARFAKEQAELLRCQGALWEEGGIDEEERPGTALGGRGILSLELHLRTLSRDAHSGNAHLLPNAAWRLVWLLGKLKDPQERILIPGFYDRVRPISPLDLELLEKLPDKEAHLKELFGVQQFVGGRTGSSFRQAIFEPTCTIQGLSAGYQGEGGKTVIPAQASVKLDFRLVPDQDPEEILDKLQAYLKQLGEEVELRNIHWMKPFRSDPRAPLVELARRTGEEVYGKPYWLNPMNGGSSPAYAFQEALGPIPVITAGVGFGIHNRTHAPNEHIRLKDFLNAARHIARILDGFASIEPWNVPSA